MKKLQTRYGGIQIRLQTAYQCTPTYRQRATTKRTKCVEHTGRVATFSTSIAIFVFPIERQRRKRVGGIPQACTRQRQPTHTNEEYQRECEFDDQLADLRAMMKHMSSTFDTKSPKNRRGGGSHGSKSASQSRSQSRSPRGSSKSRSSRSSSRSSMSSTHSHLSKKSRNSSRNSRSSHGSHKSVTVVSPRSPHKRHAQQDTRPRSRRRVK